MVRGSALGKNDDHFAFEQKNFFKYKKPLKTVGYKKTIQNWIDSIFNFCINDIFLISIIYYV